MRNTDPAHPSPATADPATPSGVAVDKPAGAGTDVDQAASQATTAADTSACSAPHVFDILAEEHALQRELCDLMEAIADGLPHTFDRARAEVVIALLEGSLPAHTILEDEIFFPALLARLPADHPVANAIQYLSKDHERETGLVLEATGALTHAINGSRHVNMEALGYLLRGLFDTMRRHLDFEDQVVFPAARQVLTPADLSSIQGWIMGSAHPRCCRQSFRALRQFQPASALCVACPDGGAGAAERIRLAIP